MSIIAKGALLKGGAKVARRIAQATAVGGATAGVVSRAKGESFTQPIHDMQRRVMEPWTRTQEEERLERREEQLRDVDDARTWEAGAVHRNIAAMRQMGMPESAIQGALGATMGGGVAGQGMPMSGDAANQGDNPFNPRNLVLLAALGGMGRMGRRML